MTNQDKVELFLRKGHQEVHNSPTWPSLATRSLRIRLILSELAELSDAQDLTSVADAIGDLLYVVYGAAVAYGLPAQKIFDEVHRSNMTKFIDGHVDEGGKVIKGPSFEPPKINEILYDNVI